MTSEVKDWLLQRDAAKSHRQLLVISGNSNWVKSAIKKMLNIRTPNSKLWVSNTEPEHDIAINQFKSVLGQEFEWVIYDGFEELRGNALLALSGCVSKGGLMILLCPAIEDWPFSANTQQNKDMLFNGSNASAPSPFSTWLVTHIQNFNGVSIWKEDATKLTISYNADRDSVKFQDDSCRTPDQFQIVEYLKSVQAKDKTQVVILADRGRGKSSALGIASSQIILDSHAKFLVTSTHRSMTAQIFKQANEIFKRADLDEYRLQRLTDNLVYLPFDRILKTLPKADWLLIDEAATLPTDILESLVKSYSKVVLSTTIHGYEGSGRGFELRFKPFLKKHFKDYQEFLMHSPIRWYDNDPLEAFWHQVMALKTTKPIGYDAKKLFKAELKQTQQYTFVTYSGDQLIHEPALLYQVFGLLVDAHYQTSPDDFVRMLDGDQQIHIMNDAQFSPVAVALTSMEGGNKLLPLSNEIAQGKRRVPGHLIPQRLAFDHYHPDYTLYRYMRIVRIAVKQNYRNRGIGSQLIELVGNQAKRKHAEFLGSSFGLTEQLAEFWFRNNFQFVKMGIKRDASSGEYSALILRALSPESISIVEHLSTICKQQIEFQKNYRLSELPAKTVEFLLAKLNKNNISESTNLVMYWRSLVLQFVEANRPLHGVELAIFKCLDELDETEIKKDTALALSFDFVNSVIVQKISYAEVREKYKLTGKKQIETAMRAHLKTLFTVAIPS